MAYTITVYSTVILWYYCNITISKNNIVYIIYIYIFANYRTTTCLQKTITQPTTFSWLMDPFPSLPASWSKVQGLQPKLRWWPWVINIWCSMERHTEYTIFVIIKIYVPWSKLLVLGMVIPPLIGNPYNGPCKPLLLGWWPSPIIWK